MAIQDTESRQWGCLDTIVSIEGCVLFKEDQPFLARHAATLGYGTHHLGRELPPQCLVDFVRRRWWAGYVKDVTGKSVQAVATEPYNAVSKDLEVARDALVRLCTDRAGRFDQLRTILGIDHLDFYSRELNPAGVNSHAIARFANQGVPLSREHAQTLLARMLLDEHFQP